MRRCRVTTQAAARAAGARGFTVVELLVVIAVLSLLIGVLLPALAGARERGRAAACASNLRQLATANELYVGDHRGHYAPGAADIVTHNRHRWHGTRDAVGVPFVPQGGSLTTYVDGPGSSRAIRACPSFVDTLDSADAFERGCGGYGYNNAYVGTHRAQRGPDCWGVVTDHHGAPAHLFRSPARTVMFADSAFAAEGIIEYSFLEPRFHADYPQARHDPSTHFRHAERANLAWLDGHVSSAARHFTWSSGLYPANPQPLSIGWVGEADDNSLYDPGL